MSVDPKSLGKVAVLLGGTSAERDISLMSGQGVLAALRSLGVDAHAFDPAERHLKDLEAEGFARCFVALHGRHGEDGCIQGALELMGLPYTGSGVMASAIAMDKVMTKRLWVAEGLPTPRSVTLSPDEVVSPVLPARLEAVVAQLGLPLVVKPPREGSSIGVTVVKTAQAMRDAVLQSARHDADVLCEQFIAGDEVTCPVIGEGASARALPVVRIVPPAAGYDYQNKYFTDDVRYLCPSGLAEAEEREIQRLTLAAYRSLGCRGWGRADLMIGIDPVTGARSPFLLEMNTSPGMTGHSLVPMSARAAGIDYPALCLTLLAGARLDVAAAAIGN